MVAAAEIAEQGMVDIYAKNVKFLAEETKIHDELRPKLAIAS